jgi:hypothetical protein
MKHAADAKCTQQQAEGHAGTVEAARHVSHHEREGSTVHWELGSSHRVVGVNLVVQRLDHTYRGGPGGEQRRESNGAAAAATHARATAVHDRRRPRTRHLLHAATARQRSSYCPVVDGWSHPPTAREFTRLLLHM